MYYASVVLPEIKIQISMNEYLHYRLQKHIMTTLESRIYELSLDVQELKGMLDSAKRSKVIFFAWCS